MAPDAPAPPSTSGLQYALHPLVLINVSDHHTRLLANRPASEKGTLPPTCVGILLGTQAGRTVDVSNSFEAPHARGPSGETLLNEAVLARKLDQYKQTFPDLEVVGWYATVPGPHLDVSFHGALHTAVASLNEAAVGLLVDPTAAPSAGAPPPGAPAAITAPLPIRLYERASVGPALTAGGPPPLVSQGGPAASPGTSPAFVSVPFSVEASEAERIGVAQAARTLPPGSTGGAAILAAHYRDLAGAVGGLAARVEALAAALSASGGPSAAPPRALARSAAALAARLPAGAGPGFGGAFAAEQVDVLATVLLATVTRGTALAAALVEKLAAAYEPVPGGGGRAAVMRLDGGDPAAAAAALAEAWGGMGNHQAARGGGGGGGEGGGPRRSRRAAGP